MFIKLGSKSSRNKKVKYKNQTTERKHKYLKKGP